MKFWVIGSSCDCDIAFDHPQVSARHCRLTKTQDGFRLQDLNSTNGVYLNGKRLTAEAIVSVSDTITLGQQLPFPWPPEVVMGDCRILNIGQAQDNDVLLDGPMISGHHARLLLRDSMIMIEDLGSTNGLGLGQPSRRIRAAIVKSSDHVFFGSYEVKVEQLLANRPFEVAPVTHANDLLPAVATRTSLAANGKPQAGSRQQVDWMGYLVAILAGLALVVICVFGVLMAISGNSSSVTGPATDQAATENQGDRQNAKTTTGRGFQMGEFNPDDTIERIKVTIRVDDEGQDLKEIVDLDLGAGFLMQVSPTSARPTASTAVALPQKSSLEGEGASIASGQEAWFEFSVDQETDDQGEFSKTPQILNNLTFAQLQQIRFAAQGNTNWVLQGYEIRINDKLFAAHDSVHWRVTRQLAADQQELVILLSKQTFLEKEITELEGYVKTGLGTDVDNAKLAEEKQAAERLKHEIEALQAYISGPYRWYTERDPAFRPSKAS